MKPHLPLSLLRSLFDTFKGVSRTTLGLGTLLLLPGATTILWHYAYDESDEGSGIRTLDTSGNSCGTYIGTAAEELEAHELENEALWELRHERARELANIAAANAEGFRHSGGGGSLVVPRNLRAKGGKNTHLLDTLLISAGVEPLQNYVAHGGGPSSSSSSSSSSNSTSAAATAPIATAAPTLRSARMMSFRSFLLAAVAEEEDSPLTWVGDEDAFWDTTSTNWTQDGEDAVLFTNGVSVLFTDASEYKTVLIDAGSQSALTLKDMTITGANYAFKGDANLNITGAFTVSMPDGTSDAQNTLSFGLANGITAGSILMSSGINTLTTFQGSVSADTLTITNCTEHEENHVAGSYVFQQGFDVAGEASITLDTADATADDLLVVSGNASAGTLLLAGSGTKIFNSAVTTTDGGLTISGSSTDSSTQGGSVYFNGVVTLGGVLTLTGNSEATFHKGINSASSDTELQIILNQGSLRYETYTDSMAAGNTLALGTVTLRGAGDMYFESNTLVGFNLIGNGQDFSLSGSSVRTDVTLTGGTGTGANLTGDFTVDAGNVYLYAAQDNSGSLSGKVGGVLTVEKGATLNLGTNGIMEEGSEGVVIREGATLNLGSTQQSVWGQLLLEHGNLTGAAGSALVVPDGTEKPTLTYSGSGNSVSNTTLQTGSTNLTLQGKDGEAVTTESNTLTLAAGSDITGTGTLTFTGSGSVSLENTLSYTGDVVVENGSTLQLVQDSALSTANSLTIGGGGVLTVTNGGSSVGLTGDLILGHNATVNFTNLTGHGSTPAITLSGGELLFGGNITFSFYETDIPEMQNLHTYELIVSDKGINQLSGTTAGNITVYVNNKGKELDSSQYSIGFYSDDEGYRHLTFTLMVGKSWQGGAEGYWHEQDASGNYVNWTEGATGDRAIFRTQTDADGKTIEDVLIHFTQPTAAMGLYMDGSSNYTIRAEGTMADGKTEAFQATNGASFAKNGTGSMTWEALTGSLVTVEINEGELSLTKGTTLTSTGSISIADITYSIPDDGSAAVKVDTAALSIDNTSRLLSGGGSISGSSAGAALLHGVLIEDASISAFHSGLSGTDDVPITHSISNAVINGFSLSKVNLQGSGLLTDTTLGAGTSFAEGAQYGLHGTIAVEATINNAGILQFHADNELDDAGNTTHAKTVVDISGLSTGLGAQEVFTVFSGGGELRDWTSLSAGNFSINGVNLADVTNYIPQSTTNSPVTVTTSADGAVKLNTTGIAFISWDKEWEIGTEVAPVIAINYEPESGQTSTSIVRNGPYNYAKRYSGVNEEDNIFTIYLSSDASGLSKFAGATSTGNSNVTSKSPMHIWVNAEDAPITSQYLAGGSFLSTPILATTHMQINGLGARTPKQVIGASYDTIQYGDSFLTLLSGDFSSTLVIAGNYADNSTGRSRYHYGNSFLHISGGTFGTVYGGSYETATQSGSYTYTDNNGDEVTLQLGGDTTVLVDGTNSTTTIGTLYGGDYTSKTYSTHMGDVLVELKGGTLTNVYAAGGTGNYNKVDGDVTVKLYAEEGGSMLSAFTAPVTTESGTTYALLSGGANALTDTTTYNSTLDFTTAGGSYDLTQIRIEQYTRFELAKDTQVSVRADLFNSNTTNSLVINGNGFVTVSGDAENLPTTPHEVELTGGATLNIRTSFYQDASTYTDKYANAAPDSKYSTQVSDAERAELSSVIRVNEGTTVDVSGYPAVGATPNLNIALYLAGSGTNGQGALYKASGGAVAGGVNLPSITLTANATIGVAQDTYLSMIANGSEASTWLDLTNGVAMTDTWRGYVLTKTGKGTFTLYNTDVTGGTIYVEEGTLRSAFSSAAGNSDLVLQSGATLQLTDQVGKDPYSGEGTGSTQNSTSNGLAIESLSGLGTVELSGNSVVYINMDRGADNLGYKQFADGFDASGLGTPLNHEGNNYAVFGGNIIDEEGTAKTGGGVIKTGGGAQYFTGSESTYTGNTEVQKGSLYLWGTSTDRDVDGYLKGQSIAEKGVIGTGTLLWSGGEVYLGNGVMLINNGLVKSGADAIIGVESEPDAQNATKTIYHEATYSGVLAGESGTSSLQKVGLGTLTLDQDGTFSGAAHVLQGSLKFFGWANPGDYSQIAVESGASVLFSYDNSLEGEITAFGAATGTGTHTAPGTTIVIHGEGDARWNSATRTGQHSAALISNIEAGKVLDIQSVISGDGNLLQADAGELTLSGANSYSGGSTVIAGSVVVANSTGLGSTAEGKDANLVTHQGTQVTFEDGVTTTLAAVAQAGNGGTIPSYDGNNIAGNITIGSEDAASAKLYMTGDGYYAQRTQINKNDVLVFCGAAASNWENGNAAMAGAGVLVGAKDSHLAVSDATGQGLTVSFTTTNSMSRDTAQPQDDDATPQYAGFAGDITVEGDAAQLQIQRGTIDGGSISISGNGAALSAENSYVYIEKGESVSLLSHGQEDSSARLQARELTFYEGSSLSVSYSEAVEYAFNVSSLASSTSYSVEEALIPNYEGDGSGGLYHMTDSSIMYDRLFDNATATNQFAAATVEARVLTLEGGTSYSMDGSNTSLAGGSLTLAASVEGDTELKIALSGAAAFEQYLATLETAQAEDASIQWVLFSDVGSFKAMQDSTTLLSGKAMQEAGLQDNLYVALASDFFTTESGSLKNVLLVYDAGAKVVYLDHVTEKQGTLFVIPEPTTATLSLLALTALAARRRRRA